MLSAPGKTRGNTIMRRGVRESWDQASARTAILIRALNPRKKIGLRPAIGKRIHGTERPRTLRQIRKSLRKTPQKKIGDKPDKRGDTFRTQLICVDTGEVLLTWEWTAEAPDKGKKVPPPK